MDDSGIIELMIKPYDVGSTNQTLHKDWKSNQSGE
jgi:hypothetical protein